MYIINNRFYSTSLKQIADHFNAPYRRLLKDCKEMGSCYFTSGGAIYLVRKVKKL